MSDKTKENVENEVQETEPLKQQVAAEQKRALTRNEYLALVMAEAEKIGQDPELVKEMMEAFGF